ncbi:hypothetical protein [Lactococcus kimchii]|uniref:hypothetical protein n=1 Tax=Lactococcus sp. S-13 TaxID=2507158 RepID=UPI001022ABA2|nr:hypothetical protein [Lactococcus sp. S-13]RZI48051.1 hypothetical protein EQJ87_00505 [Lactococcus sp. S-13]
MSQKALSYPRLTTSRLVSEAAVIFIISNQFLRKTIVLAFQISPFTLSNLSARTTADFLKNPNKELLF